MRLRWGPSSVDSVRKTSSLEPRGCCRSGAAARHPASVDLLQLLQRAQVLGHRRAGMRARPVGVAHLADIDAALGIDGQTVRREELARLLARPMLAAQALDRLALPVDDGEARADVGVPGVDRHAGAELADDEVRILAAAAVERARPV